MSDIAQLVTEAAAQVAAAEVRLRGCEQRAMAYPALQPLPEALEQELVKLRSHLEHMRAMHARLLEKQLANTPPIETL